MKQAVTLSDEQRATLLACAFLFQAEGNKPAEADIRALLAAHPTEQRMSDAGRDVLAERARQVIVEGWTPDHDDEHDEGEMASAAAAYAAHSCGWNDSAVRDLWPPQWHLRWLKTAEPRRDLVKAGALILAEIERIDRGARKIEIECCRGAA